MCHRIDGRRGCRLSGVVWRGHRGRAPTSAVPASSRARPTQGGTTRQICGMGSRGGPNGARVHVCVAVACRCERDNGCCQISKEAAMAEGDITTYYEGGTWKSKVKGSSRAAHTGAPRPSNRLSVVRWPRTVASNTPCAIVTARSPERTATETIPDRRRDLAVDSRRPRGDDPPDSHGHGSPGGSDVLVGQGAGAVLR